MIVATQSSNITVALGTYSASSNQPYTVRNNIRIKGFAINALPNAAAGNTMIPFYTFTIAGTPIAQHAGNGAISPQYTSIMGSDKYFYPLDIPIKAGEQFTVYIYVNVMNTDAADQSFSFRNTLFYEND